MRQRPRLRDYILQIPNVLLNIPLSSNKTIYYYAHHKLLWLGQIPIIVGMLFVFNYSPYSTGYYTSSAKMIAWFIGVLLVTAYWVLFVYRFGHCCTLTADHKDYDNVDAYKYYFKDCLKQDEHIKKTKKTYRSFAVFTAAITAVTIAYCMLGFGMAHLRLYNNHKQELDRFMEICEKYDYVNVCHVISDYSEPSVYTSSSSNREVLTKDEIDEIQQILTDLDGNYISDIIRDPFGNDCAVTLWSKWGPNSDLVWYPYEATYEEVQNDMDFYTRKKIIRLDDHWWHVWGYELGPQPERELTELNGGN